MFFSSRSEISTPREVGSVRATPLGEAKYIPRELNAMPCNVCLGYGVRTANVIKNVVKEICHKSKEQNLMVNNVIQPPLSSSQIV